MSTLDPTAVEPAGGLIEVEDLTRDVVETPAAAPTNGNGAAEPSLAGSHVAAPEPPVEEAAAIVPIAPILPTPVIPLPRRTVSGRYRGQIGPWRLELRVDLDGRRPMRRISGDFYHVTGGTVSYFGSFVVNVVTVTTTAVSVTAEGDGTFTWSAGAPRLRVTIPRNTIVMPPGMATAQFMTAAGAPGALYRCPFESPFFRTVQYEQDHVLGTTPFVSYNTGSLPAPPPARPLTVATAFAEAGIGLQTSGTWNAVDPAGAGPNATWSNAELHASMETQFSLWKDEPQWKVWFFLATVHDLGPSLRGIMFDQKGRQRQGCAAFHNAISGGAPEVQRAQLRTYVHELGHCFNLLHSWQKSFAVPPAPNRPNALSWMNYPQNYPGGAAAYWAAFPFQFDDLEVIHLRHAFRDNVIPGGQNFAIGAALVEPQAFADMVEENSGLALRLEAMPSFAFGAPVTVELKLSPTDTRGKRVNPQLHPDTGFVQIGIRKPGGHVVVYEPIIERCVEPEPIFLDAENPAIYESFPISFGRDGFYFDQPGPYEIRALYYALDGSLVLSNVLKIWVRHPLSRADEEIAEHLLDDQAGMLIYLRGSDSPYLEQGNESLDWILEKHGEHPLALWPRLAKGTNLQREFKCVRSDHTLGIRKPAPRESAALLADVVEAAEKGAPIDNLMLNRALQDLAEAQRKAGAPEQVAATKKRMVSIFRKKSLNPFVMRTIEAQAESL